MIKQTLMFTNPASLSLRYGQLVISLKDCDQEITRPIEDIGVVIVENQMVHFTVPLLNALADNNVAVIFCAKNGMPNTMLMPLEANTTQQETLQYQIEASQPTKKRIWKEIVEYKIRNQAAALKRIGKNGDVLKPYYSNVLSGDSDNREGIAARIYWQQMYGNGFVRNRDGTSPNMLLNYGYAILRAAVTRALLGSGLFPALGLFHRNRYNAFPLADDVMEPYRPFVDEIVYNIYESNPDIELDKEVKAALVRLLQVDVKMNKRVHPLQLAITSTTASLVKALKDNQEKIKYPTFV